jgi:hypothetical protein
VRKYLRELEAARRLAAKAVRRCACGRDYLGDAARCDVCAERPTPTEATTDPPVGPRAGVPRQALADADRIAAALRGG